MSTGKISRQTTKLSSKSTASKKETTVEPATKEEDDTVDLTPEIIAEYREAFSLFDEDGDENITTNELAHVFRSLGQNPNDDHIAEMVKDVDTDGDGTVSFQEFLTMMVKSMKRSDSEEELKEVYRIFCKYTDASESGLSAHGIKSILLELGDKISDEEAIQMVKLADKNGDGLVDFEEFVNILNQM